VAGIVSGYPGLRLDVEGHTDSIGGDEYNQRLSEQRGTAVREYLVEQGMPGTSVTAKGFGETQPVASNDIAEGRPAEPARRVSDLRRADWHAYRGPVIGGMRLSKGPALLVAGPRNWRFSGGMKAELNAGAYERDERGHRVHCRTSSFASPTGTG